MPEGKALARRLFDYYSAADIDIATLRGLGWFEFFRLGIPDTDDARIVSAEAVHWLLVSPDDVQIQHDDSIIYATLAFVRSVRGGQLPTQVDRGLRAVLARRPVDRDELTHWFLQTFP